MIYSKPLQLGFTLIEMIVSLALFSVVVTVAIGALLMLVSTNNQLQGEQSVMTNLSFALDSMTREIRTGTFYVCASEISETGVFASGADLDTLNNSVNDCPTGSQGINYHGIAFKEAGDSITGSSDERILYYFDRTKRKLYRKVGSQEKQSIVASGVFLTDVNFFVSGTDPVTTGDNSSQPTVTIFIEASDPKDPTGKSYYIQTTITQRVLDI